MDDIPIGEEAINRIREARLDQGIHELEFSFNGEEASLKTALFTCEKNPNHENFIPVDEITLDKFPESVQVQFVLDFILIKAKETVRISCNHTSEERPVGYIFHNHIGSTLMRYGSGRVWGVFKDKIQTDIPCPFEDCTEVEGPHTVSGYFRVHTAKHVVFDDAEARKTKIDFFYDRADDYSTIVTARGVKVFRSDTEDDYCVIDCVTHDPELCNTMDSVRREWSSAWPEVDKVLYGKNVAVVISHPHGCSKQISIGDCLDKMWGKINDTQSWYRYTYKAPTCPGCSGAPVWVPGENGLASSYAPHCGYEGNEVNRSTVWFLWKANNENTE